MNSLFSKITRSHHPPLLRSSGHQYAPTISRQNRSKSYPSHCLTVSWSHALFLLSIIATLLPLKTHASDEDIKIPPLNSVTFSGLDGLSGVWLMYGGLIVCALGMIFGLVQYKRIKALPVHNCMARVSAMIWETCKTYLLQQGKFLVILWLLVASCIFFYFRMLEHVSYSALALILTASLVGINGAGAVAWFGIRINTTANSRTAFSALRAKPLDTLAIPLRSGMSVGLLLVCIELFFMICILVFLPRELAGPCFIGFAIGESLGAAALRICGGIFTKIADIGSDLMKITFKLPEDDPKNPGVIADCTGDNAGDSVGPTADGFETYGVTGVALIAFLALTLAPVPVICATLIIWLFTMRMLMIVTSLASYGLNNVLTRFQFKNKNDFDFETPLTHLVWITSTVSIVSTFIATWFLLGKQPGLDPNLWWAISAIISCGTAAGALIPEFTKIFTSMNSQHVKEVTTCSKHGGASLNILAGFVAGNFSGFWMGLCIAGLMVVAWMLATFTGSPIFALMPDQFKFAAPVFAFGLVAFGFLGMGPVTIAVDSYGPVTDNAQSVYELSQIETLEGVEDDIVDKFGFIPDFETGKLLLEKGDGCGNTFKATAKPVLIGTAVVGATTMVFGIIILLQNLSGDVIRRLSLVQPEIIVGLLVGGATVYWFTGASTQAVVTGAYRAVVFIKNHLNLHAREASPEDSKEVVRICTVYAQRGMWNIFITVFCLALALAFFNPYLFIGYLVGIAFFGLFQAIFMANAGGAWDNAKKIVEVNLRKKGTELHAATVVGDTVGDPFKDTSSVALNPVIKFTTLFGLLAVEIAVTMQNHIAKLLIAGFFFLVALVFVWRSFYAMRIPEEDLTIEEFDLSERAGLAGLAETKIEPRA
ncbi:MAG TPA: sodium-translocating pyrophosphatase [Alphaproteobacteria bacterium]|nr:sodium-translocating pyrophosphatase [Alphaproteobacteria bacterium]